MARCHALYIIQNAVAKCESLQWFTESLMPLSEAERLQKILQGAFDGPPTPLKNIPTRHGNNRKLERKSPQRRRRKKRAA